MTSHQEPPTPGSSLSPAHLHPQGSVPGIPRLGSRRREVKGRSPSPMSLSLSPPTPAPTPPDEARSAICAQGSWGSHLPGISPHPWPLCATSHLSHASLCPHICKMALLHQKPSKVIFRESHGSAQGSSLQIVPGCLVKYDVESPAAVRGGDR